MQAVLGRRRASRRPQPAAKRRDEQRGAADVEDRVVERDLFGEQAAGAGGRGLAFGDPHHDREIAGERDTHDLPAGDRDDAAVDRGGGVVGVALELGRDPQCLGAGFAGRVAVLRVDREQAGDARGGREAQTAPAGKAGADAQRTLTARVAKRADRRMRLRRGLVAVREHFEVRSERDPRARRTRDQCSPTKPGLEHANRFARASASHVRACDVIAAVRRDETGTVNT